MMATDDRSWKFRTSDGLSIRIPSSVKRFTREDLIRINHGVSYGDPCHSCGEPYTEDMYPSMMCLSCKAPAPRVCARSGCSAVIMPEKVERANGAVAWYDGPSFCGQCENKTSRGERGQVLKGVFPSRLLRCAKDYARLKARDDLDRTLHVWAISNNLGRDVDEAVMVIYGSRGSGKSVALTRAGSAIYMKGRASSIKYVEADEVYRYTGDKYADAPDLRSEARAGIKGARSCGLLIVDGLRPRQGITASQKAELSQIISYRVREGKPTILCQDMDTPDLTWLDAPLGEHMSRIRWRVRCDCDAISLTRGS